jgi:hypothetical protein
MIGDWPESGERVDTSVHSDVDEDIYATERDFPESHSPVRAVDQVVVNTGEKKGVRTYIIPGPLICEYKSRDAGQSRLQIAVGRGTGLFTEGIRQLHMMVKLALKKKQAVQIGSGSGVRAP